MPSDFGPLTPGFPQSAIRNPQSAILHANCLQGDPIFSLAPVFVLCYPIHTFPFGSIYFSGAPSVHWAFSLFDLSYLVRHERRQTIPLRTINTETADHYLRGGVAVL